MQDTMDSRPAANAAALRRHRFVSISRQLYFVAALVLAIIIGFATHQLLQVRDSMLADTERQMARLDMVFAEQTGRAVETVDLLMRDAIDSAEVYQGGLIDAPQLAQRLTRRIDGVRQVSELIVVGRDRRIVAGSHRVPGEALPPGLAAQLDKLAATQSRALQFSEPFRREGGAWSALMVRGIPGPRDTTEGTVIACLNLQYFEDFYKAVELSENGAILLHRRDGTVLARYPHDDKVVGVSYADLPPFRDVLSKAQAGTVVMNSPLDGSTRVLAIRALKAFPLAVNISVDQGMIMAPWRRQAFALAGLALLASAIVGTLMTLLAKRSRQVEVLVGEFSNAKDIAEQTSVRLREQMAERQRAEAALQQAQRIEVVGQLTGGVAHDFNNLLTVVLGNLEVLQRTTTLDPAQERMVEVIRSAAERGASLTAQLLAFARRQPLQPVAVDVGAMLSGMTGLLASALGSRIRVESAVQPDVWPALIDPTQVELLVLNLAINARDAMPDGGTLRIGAGNIRLGPPIQPEDPQAGDYVRIVVSDTGVGMPPDVRAKAFEPFFTTKGPGRGSGLGLSQVYGVVRQMGGAVQIESSEGHGTSVTVLVPRARLAQPAMAPLPVQPAAPGMTPGAAVLLVDDDAAVRGTTAQMLRFLGYTVAEAESGPAALRLIEQGAAPDVVLTDVAMPDMSGPDFAERLRGIRPRLPLVFITGYADPEAVAKHHPMPRLVRKPFRPAELTVQIEAALADERAVA